MAQDYSMIECDVLVVGGGLSGCWSAIKAAEIVPRVILAEKVKVSRNGKSSFSGAGILCPEPEDDLDSWHKEVVERGKYINDQDWVRVVLQEQRSRLSDMEKWGVPFERNEKGKIIRYTAFGNIVTRTASVASLEMMECMRKQLLACGVKLYERTMITELVTSDGQLPTKGSACGAIGFNTESGEILVFSARAVVLASGGTGYLDLTGDGITQAFRAGAEAQNMEFTRSSTVGLARKFPGLHLITFQKLGMILRNAKGERFMEKYQPILKENVNRDDLTQAISSEYLEGRGPIYMDLTHLSTEDLEKLRNSPATATQVMNIEKEGYDLGKELIEFHVSTGPLTNQSAGIKNNIYGETNIPGLYVAGETGGYPTHGAYSLGGVNLAMCCVGGYRAGEYSATYAKQTFCQKPSEGQIQELIQKTMSPLKIENGIKPNQFQREIDKFLSPGDISLFKVKNKLEMVLSRVEEWEEASAHLSASDWHELAKANKMKNYLLIVKLVFIASLMREESRGCHIRLDYPYKDDINWLKWIVLRSDAERVSHSLMPIPIYRYLAKPQKYEKHAVNLPPQKS